MISLRQVRFSYSEEIEILKGIDLTINPGEKFVLAGKSGSGKSTLLKLIAGLLSPSSGKITSEANSKLTYGYVKQQPENQVITGSVEEEVTFGLLCRSVDRRKIAEEVKRVLSDVGLSGMEKRNSTRLSGGELQRLVFAASHVLKPDIWILDEPTAYLDEDGKKRIHELIHALSDNSSVIYVTSDPEEYELFDRLLLLHDGRIITDEHPDVVWNNHTLEKIGLNLPLAKKIKRLETIDLETASERKKEIPKEKPEKTIGLEAAGLSASRKQLFDKPLKVLNKIDLKIKNGEIVALVGKSGAGKTTLIETLAGVLKPSTGKVLWNGVVPQKLFGKIGVAFQFPERNFFSETILDEISYGLKNIGMSINEAEEIALQTMEKFKLNTEYYKGRNPFEISGGQARRVALAATWALRPDALLLDEPTVGLDAENREIIAGLITEEAERGCPVLLAGHDLETFMVLAERWIVLENGRIVYDGNVGDLWSDDPEKDVISPPSVVKEFRRTNRPLEEAQRLGWGNVMKYLSRR